MESRIQNPKVSRATAKSFEDVIVIGHDMERLEEVSRLLESYCRTLLNSEF
jgi:hypothetical protein